MPASDAITGQLGEGVEEILGMKKIGERVRTRSLVLWLT